MLRKVSFLRNNTKQYTAIKTQITPPPAPFAPVPYNRLKKEYKELKNTEKLLRGKKRKLLSAFRPYTLHGGAKI